MKTLAKAITAVCCLAFILSAAAMGRTEPAAEAEDSLPLINSRSWPASGITKIELDYSKGDFIFIEPSAGGAITLNEYLSENDAGYCAAAAQSGGNLTFTQGRRPNGSCNSHTVLLLPENYAGTVAVNSGGGAITLRHMAGAAAYDLSCTLGQIQISGVTAKTIKASCPRAGTLKILDTTAALDVAFSGKIIVSGSAASGHIKDSGQPTQMTVNLSHLSGDLSIENASGSAVLGLPAEEAFRLNGSVTKPGGGRISNAFGHGKFTVSGNTITGANGSDPSKTVTAAASDKLTLQAAPAAGNLTITAKNAATVDVQPASDGQFSYDCDKSKYTVTTAANGSSFEIQVTGKPGAAFRWEERVIIRIPDRAYALITAVSEKSGLSLPAVNANINVTNNSGSVIVKLPSDYSKTVNYTGRSGSGSLIMNGAGSFAVSAAFDSCAVSVPASWPACSNGSSNYSHTSGSGAGKIHLDLTNCSFSILQ